MTIRPWCYSNKQIDHTTHQSSFTIVRILAIGIRTRHIQNEKRNRLHITSCEKKKLPKIDFDKMPAVAASTNDNSPFECKHVFVELGIDEYGNWKCVGNNFFHIFNIFQWGRTSLTCWLHGHWLSFVTFWRRNKEIERRATCCCWQTRNWIPICARDLSDERHQQPFRNHFDYACQKFSIILYREKGRNK